MDVIFKITASKYLPQLPIVNGQLIILKDTEAMYYDINDSRHRVSLASGVATVVVDEFATTIGVGNAPTPGDLLEVGNGQVIDSEGNLLPEDEQVRSNAFRVTRDGIAIAQYDVQTETGLKLSDREYIGNKVIQIGDDPTDAEYPSAKAVKDYVESLPEPMVFKGSLGSEGTITELPDASTSNTGFTYKVITDGTYDSKNAKSGDTFISDGSEWILIPSGDEPSGTVTNVNAEGSEGIEVTGGPISSSGTFVIKGLPATPDSAGTMSAQDKQKMNNTNIGYGECTTDVGTTIKVVELIGNTKWALQPGSLAFVKFTNGSTAESPTLNVNDTGAKAIHYKRGEVPPELISPGDIATLLYDGSHYNLISIDTSPKVTYSDETLNIL